MTEILIETNNGKYDFYIINSNGKEIHQILFGYETDNMFIVNSEFFWSNKKSTT